MLKKTHLAIGLAVGLYFLPYVNSKFIFLPVIIIASLLPDIDSGFSGIGKNPVFKPTQWMVKHRGVLHSYTVCILISFVFAFYIPVLALPFFLGYAFHLFADSFTVNGIKPFWPLKFVSKGIVRTGGKVEQSILVVTLIVCFLLGVRLLF